MRNTIATLVSFVLLTVFGGSAFAGTSAYNKYNTTNEWGSRSTDIQVDQVNVDRIDATSTSIKLESDQGNVNRVNLKFDGDTFTGNGTGGVVYGTTTTENSHSLNKETVSVDTHEAVTFDSTEYTHTVGSDY